MTRLLGIQIAHGFSPEARVFAGLLAHVGSNVAVRVLHQASAEDSEALARFAQAARTDHNTELEVLPVDFGWRSISPDRGLRAKVKERLRFVSSLPRALALARQFQPDVVYSCQQQWDCRTATYVARRLHRPQIIHLHYTIGPWLHQPILDRLRTCAHVVTVSNFIHEEALAHRIPADRVTTIRNTITVSPTPDVAATQALRTTLGIQADAPLVGIVARVDPEKGQADTLRAFAAIEKQFPRARLLVVGAESAYRPGYLDQIKQVARELKIENKTLFLGQRNDVPLLLSTLDVFIHPSRREPFGLALLEAQAAGLPTLAYAEGGACEIVEDGVTGLLAPPGDVAALSAHLGCLLSEPARARAMGQVARRRTETAFVPAHAGRAFADLLARAPWNAGTSQ